MQTIPIFLSSDNLYAPFVATTIASICTNTTSYIEFYILDSGICKENIQKIEKLKKKFKNFSLEFIQINENYLKDIIEYQNNCKHVTRATYNRFLISKLKPKLNKVLYLDVDLIVLDDIKILYDISLDSYSLGAIPELFDDDNNTKERKKTLCLHQNHQYFNAGVLLIDVQKWTKENLVNQLFETENKYRKNLKWADQDILNIVFNNNYKILDEKFNFMTQKNNINSNIIIRHFNTNIKPWFIAPNCNKYPIYLKVNNSDEFWKYAKRTCFYKEIKYNCIYKNPPFLIRVFRWSKKIIKRLLLKT